MKLEYTFWEEGDHFLGYLNEFPDYWTQGENLEDLREHLKDLHSELNSGAIPGIRKVAEIEIA